MDRKIAFHDDGIGPNAGHQLLPGDRLAGPLDQCDEDVPGTTAEAHKLIAFQQKALLRKDVERAEQDLTLGRNTGRLNHRSPRFGLLRSP